ncbi:hypothetical protein AMOR_38420 [Anaeromyxobacter oryzae]|uniref:Uncharacterized protein n=1 Tax=Anaeromyxobacter oryzae TaxID=2918170 RepID=A0ABM7WZD6_9BACT|nr:hypothetical protein AMOR_38420 [Anaeromyxobacter oryzae]
MRGRPSNGYARPRGDIRRSPTGRPAPCSLAVRSGTGAAPAWRPPRPCSPRNSRPGAVGRSGAEARGAAARPDAPRSRPVVACVARGERFRGALACHVACTAAEVLSIGSVRSDAAARGRGGLPDCMARRLLAFAIPASLSPLAARPRPSPTSTESDLDADLDADLALTSRWSSSPGTPDPSLSPARLHRVGERAGVRGRPSNGYARPHGHIRPSPTGASPPPVVTPCAPGPATLPDCRVTRRVRRRVPGPAYAARSTAIPARSRTPFSSDFETAFV